MILAATLALALQQAPSPPARQQLAETSLCYIVADYFVATIEEDQTLNPGTATRTQHENLRMARLLKRAAESKWYRLRDQSPDQVDASAADVARIQEDPTWVDGSAQWGQFIQCLHTLEIPTS